uniref:Arcadin 1 domain-containing protein n=1 Tax=Thermofilum pendens TaxID=2269 RepID=A0A7C1P6Y6_THEPE
MVSVTLKARVTNISLIDSPTGEKLVRIDMSEEREVPGPVIMHENSELGRELAPILSQMFRMLPGLGQGAVRLPRASLVLTEDEWERLPAKPSIGDFFEIEVQVGRVSVRREES